MQHSDSSHPLFAQAVAAIDSGDVATLRALLDAHPQLARERLIGLVADNPIRNGNLPANIIEVTQVLTDAIRVHAPETLEAQLDDALGLVATGRIPKESGVQIALMDLLIGAGARPGGALGAIAHGNPEAAAYLVSRGAELNFATAVGLGWREEVVRLAATATLQEWDLALIVAAFRGNAEMIWYLLRGGASVKGVPADCQGFHGHATALHQAVSSGSIDSVKLLVEAGSELDATDSVYKGTPAGWADYLASEGEDEEMKLRYREIDAYLRTRN